MCGKCLATRLTTGTTWSASGIARAPPGQKSFWTSTTSSTSVSVGVNWLTGASPCRNARRRDAVILGICGPSFDLEDAVDLDRDAEGQRFGADGHAGVLAGLAEDLGHQIRGAVDHPRLFREVGGAVDQPEQLDHTGHAVESSGNRVLDLGQDLERGLARRLVAALDRQVAAALADITGLAVDDRPLAGDVDEMAGDDRADIAAARRKGRRQRDAELVEPCRDASAHDAPHAISKTASTSTTAPSGRELVPMAKRACLPMSPKT